MKNQHRRLPRILVLGKPSARDHADEGLAHHLLMTAVDSVRRMPTTRGSGQLHLLACEGLERDLLHANSVPGRRMPGYVPGRRMPRCRPPEIKAGKRWRRGCSRRGRAQVRLRRMTIRGKPPETESVSAALVKPTFSNRLRVPTKAMVRSTFWPLLSTGWPSTAGAPLDAA